MNEIMKKFLEQLEVAIKAKNKKEILSVYEEITMLDFEQIDNSLLDLYDELAAPGNNILYAR